MHLTASQMKEENKVVFDTATTLRACFCCSVTGPAFRRGKERSPRHLRRPLRGGRVGEYLLPPLKRGPATKQKYTFPCNVASMSVLPWLMWPICVSFPHIHCANCTELY